MGMQPILPLTLSVTKIKCAARQRYGDGDGVARYEQALTDNTFKSLLEDSCLLNIFHEKF